MCSIIPPQNPIPTIPVLCCPILFTHHPVETLNSAVKHNIRVYGCMHAWRKRYIMYNISVYVQRYILYRVHKTVLPPNINWKSTDVVGMLSNIFRPNKGLNVICTLHCTLRSRYEIFRNSVSSVNRKMTSTFE